MSGERRRLFLALWPDSATRSRLAAEARRLSDRPVADENLHMTLAFLGECDQQKQQCIDKVISSNISQQFEIIIDYCDSWRRSGTLWLGVGEPPDELGELVDTLRLRLADCGFDFEKRPFVPHVTLSRKLPGKVHRQGIEPVRWQLDSFVLAESLPIEGGVRYCVRQRWALSGST